MAVVETAIDGGCETSVISGRGVLFLLYRDLILNTEVVYTCDGPTPAAGHFARNERSAR